MISFNFEHRRPKKVSIDYGVYSHIGQRLQNQDSVKVISDSTRLMDKIWLFAVADGMGGHRGGGVASGLACDGLNQFFEKQHDPMQTQQPKDICDRLIKAIFRADRHIRLRGLKKPDLEDMGSTVSCLAVTPEHSIIAHVGDSRIYRLRNGHLSCLTVDHTFVQDMIFEGEVPPDKAHLHPLAHMLTRVVGSQEPLTHVDSRIDPVKTEDRFLLCSDGLYNTLTSNGIHDLLSLESDPSETAVKLVMQALKNGSRDNITAIVVNIKGV